MVVGGPTVGKPGRDGEVVGLHHDDGTPPYDIRWSDTGRVTLYFPGPDAHVRHLGDAEESRQTARHSGGRARLRSEPIATRGYRGERRQFHSRVPLEVPWSGRATTPRAPRCPV